MDPPRTHKNYQIGIICALAIEKAAMVAMLDETHPKLEKEHSDENEYTLGRIRAHNVIIACLPAGLIGNGPAAIVANNMRRTFPIKFGLMVGIGGGVWSKKDDIRLGDVVVSQPTGAHGGVVQWDFGKTEKGGTFQRTGSLNKPPLVLLHALQELKTYDRTDGIDIKGSLSFMNQNKPRMSQTYRNQGADHDQLFEATYDHEGDETCDKCDPKLIVHRLARDDSTPRIHYGNIASGNEVIKHGTTREKIANKEGVICFEMEAAGLMDNFQCLVIRGICDYADSHKNKIWQPYAAATAAAFARELLGFIDKQETIEPETIKPSQPSRFTRDEQDCLKSLYFPEMDQRRNDIGRAAHNTCAWLLNHQNYSTWLGQRYGLLWIKGKPGSGKSILMDTVLRNVERQARADGLIVASFFFHGRGSPMQRTPIGLFRSIMHQILRQAPHLLSKFCSEFILRRDTRGTPGAAWDWDVKHLQGFLETEVLDMSEIYPIKIFVDALDECGEIVGRELVSYFRQLTSKSPATRYAMNVCFSCRHYPVMDSEGGGLEICVEEENATDIASYVRYNISSVFKDREAQQSLEHDILNKASGVFMWVALVVAAILELERNGQNIKAIRKELNLMPSGLEEYYQGILEKIPEKNLPKSLQLIQWICLANRPLSLDELSFAMGFDAETPHQSFQEFKDSADYVEDDEQMEKRVKLLSGGLVEVRRWYGRVAQFIHQSVKDYFIHGGLQSLEEYSSKVYPARRDPRICGEISSSSAIGRGNHRLSRSCIKYFTMEEILQSITKYDRTMKHEYPFLQYAVTYWISHARKAEMENIPQQDLLDCFQWPSNSILDKWIFMYSDICWRYLEFRRGATFIHLASKYGFLSVLTTIFRRNKDTDPDPKDSQKCTPLWLAARHGHYHVTKLLLEKGADPNSENSGDGRTPLLCAAEDGNTAIVRLLIEKNATLYSQDSLCGQPPLWWAANNGHEDVVKLLLKEGSDQVFKSLSGQSPLSWAAENGRMEMVKLLLEAGANPNTESSFNQTPLLFAIKNAHHAVAELLLENEANPDTKDSKYDQTPLSWAAEHGCMASLKLLLEKGANPNFMSNSIRTPMSFAAMHGYEAIMKLLFEKGATADSKINIYGRTLLSWAAKKGHEWAVEPLLSNDAALDGKDDEYERTPLSWAAEYMHVAIVKLLLQNGANPHLSSRSNRTPLLYAAESGCEAIVELLLRNNADPNSRDSIHDRPPLTWAAKNGHKAVVTLLLHDETVDPNSKDSRDQTPLWWAATYGHEAVIKLLLAKGAELNSRSSSGQTPLSRAVESGNLAVVKLLLKEGADPNIESSFDWTPLSLAAQIGRAAMVKLLLENGADPNKLDSGKTPLSWAAGNDHRAAAKELLVGGADPFLDEVAYYYPWLLELCSIKAFSTF